MTRLHIPFNQSPNYQTNFQSQQDFYQTQKNNFIQEQTRRNSALKAFSSINGFSRTLKYQNNPFCEIEMVQDRDKIPEPKK